MTDAPKTRLAQAERSARRNDFPRTNPIQPCASSEGVHMVLIPSPACDVERVEGEYPIATILTW